MGMPRFPDFGETYEGWKLRDLADKIGGFLSKMRLDGPLIIGGGRTITKYFGASATWDPPNVAAGAQTTQTITVTGVKLAEFNTVAVGFTRDLQGMQLTGYVSADDTVTVVLRNGTAGAINLASGTLSAGVFKHG